MARPIAAARGVVVAYAAARDQVEDLAEGFALLDLVQGGAAPRHPAVSDLVSLVRGESSRGDDPLLERWYAVYFTAYRRLQRALLDP